MALGSIDRIVSDRTGKVTYRARWQYIDERGQRRHRSQCFPTKKQAQDKLASVQHHLRAGSYVEASAEPFGAFVTRYLATKRHAWRRPSTYTRMARAWATMGRDALAGVPLSKVTPSRIQALYDALSQRGYSPQSVQVFHAFLSGALDAAVREGALARNPARGLSLPTRTRTLPVTWTREQVSVFLAAVAPREDAALWAVFVYTGMRIGEVIALRWEDVDFARGALSVRRTASQDVDGKRAILDGAKTASSNRLIVLPKPCLAALKWHRQITASDGWVFADERGGPIAESTIRTQLDAVILETGLPRITPHGLRHSYASLALQAGVPMKVVQETLGHASLAMTMDLYSHVTESLQRTSADQFETFLRGNG